MPRVARSDTPGLLHHVLIRAIERRKIFNDDQDREDFSILFQVEKEYITGRGRQKDRVRARDLLCYWTVVELGTSMVDMARKFEMAPATVSYAVQRGEKMAKEEGYQLET